MIRSFFAAAAGTLALSVALHAQYVAVDTPLVAITNVRVIDGTGAAPASGQTVVLDHGRIAAVGPAASTTVPRGALVIDGSGKSLIPGLVMVHEHMFYPSGANASYTEHPFTFPKLYLGAGITTARTAGSVEPYADLNIRKWIDAGTLPGPALDVTGPYLNGPNPFAQMYSLKDADDARRTVSMWADLGATSFKAYMQITRDELRAAIDEAHRRGLRITGHLCSVTLREAAALGIDNIEHGIAAASDFAPGKKPDSCVSTIAAVAAMDPATDTTLASVIRTLVDHRVAVTSTLAVFETFAPGRPATPIRILDAMTTDARLRYLQSRAATAAATQSPWGKVLRNEMAFEKMFVDAGGMLLAGTDPTGYGGVIPGMSSQREVELLVEAGFSPVQAIRIATLNGATYLGRADRIGSIAVGKDADLVLIDGDPAARISDIEKVELVFKHGMGYDSAKLLASGRGMVGSQ